MASQASTRLGTMTASTNTRPTFFMTDESASTRWRSRAATNSHAAPPGIPVLFEHGVHARREALAAHDARTIVHRAARLLPTGRVAAWINSAEETSNSR